MKKNKFFIAILGLSIVFSACQKNYLDRTPQTAISDGDYWRSTNDLRLYINNFYNGLPSYIKSFFTAGIYSEDDIQGSDNMINRNYRGDFNGERTLPSTGGGWTSGDWSSIRSVNYFLNHYQSVSGDPAEINKYVGEALFFKAWHYFSKLKAFGDLPWLTKPLSPGDSTELNAPRLSRAIVVDSLMNILDQAITYLPAKGGAGYENFRVYKELAAALQSRIALYEGTWEKYHAGTPYGVQGSDGTRFLQKAASSAKLVMDANKFGIDNIGKDKGYWNLFNKEDYNSSKEVMFWRKYNPTDGNVTYIAAYMIFGGGRGITRSLVDAYLCTDGKPISVSPLYMGDDNLVNVSANRDPRLSQTVQINDGKHYLYDNYLFDRPAYYAAAAEDRDYTGYQLYKGLDTIRAHQNTTNGVQGLILFRYAEVLLNYIEAQAELGVATQADVDMTINKLRSRVGMPALNIAAITPDPAWSFATLSPLINEVRRERRVELACEGYRHDDIWRWAAAGTLIKGWKPIGAKRAQFESFPDGAKAIGQYPIDANGYIFPYKNNVVGVSGYNFRTDRDYLLPIPTDQLLLNPNLKQNPGWPQ